MLVLVKEKVLLLGASGSMGGQAFKELWDRKLPNGERKYDVVLLQRPSETNKKLFAPYEKQCGITEHRREGLC